jgi:transposase
MASRQFLTDEQWTVLSPLLPPPKPRVDGRGRPFEHDDRSVLDGDWPTLAMSGMRRLSRQ